MPNELERNLTELATQGGKIAAGAKEHAATIAMGNNTAENITPDGDALVESILAAGAGKTELSKRIKFVNNVLKEARSFLRIARDSFKPDLGFSHNIRWSETGLIGSLVIPAKELKVLQLLNAFKVFMAGHPAMESAGRNITAVRAEELYDSLDNAGTAVNSQTAVVKQTMQTRNARAKQLRIRLRGTINTLKQVLGPLDPRWASFGLNEPGVKLKPEAPENLRVVLMDNHAAAMKWEAAPRAEYYRVWMKVNGIDLALGVVGSPEDLDFLLENLPPNSTIEIAVSAINSGGESALSEVVAVQTAE